MSARGNLFLFLTKMFLIVSLGHIKKYVLYNFPKNWNPGKYCIKNKYRPSSTNCHSELLVHCSQILNLAIKYTFWNIWNLCLHYHIHIPVSKIKKKKNEKRPDPLLWRKKDDHQLWLPSHTDTAGHTKAFDYPVTQTRRDIPRPLITQSHRHGWTYQGLWLPSHTDTAGHTKAFDYPVTQTRLDIPRSLITQSHRHGWTYQGLWLPSHTDTAGHTKAFDYPVTQTWLDIPRSLITQSWLDIPMEDQN